jgi:hypothetical protein
MIFSNVFILSTGRCGSTTFAKACEHFSNYSSGHETRSHLLGSSRFSYPSFHIESDNRLSWLLGRLDEEFGDTAFYVHLTRNVSDTARSFAKRRGGIMAAYQGSGIIMGCKEDDQYKIACDYIDTVTRNITLFLSNKSHKMNFRLEHAKEDFIRFCLQVDAQGDIQESLQEFDVAHNASE